MVEILRAAGRNTPLADDVDLDELGADLDGYSAADCAAVLREAALTAMRESLEASTVTAAHVAKARARVRPSLDPAQVAWLSAYAKPGESWTRCIRVSYGGSLAADVHLYLKDSTGVLGPLLSMRILQGTQTAATFPNCTGFTADGTAGGTGIVYVGPATSPVAGTYETGLPVVPFGQIAWVSNTSIVYQFELTLDPTAPDTVQGSSTGSMTVVWEARNH